MHDFFPFSLHQKSFDAKRNLLRSKKKEKYIPGGTNAWCNKWLAIRRVKRNDFIMKRYGILLFTLTLCLFLRADPGRTADVERGRLLFESPLLGGGTSGKSCLTCHEGGRDFSEKTLTEAGYAVMGLDMKTLPEVINFCIEVALRGEGIPEDGPEMEDLIAYLHAFIRGKRAEP